MSLELSHSYLPAAFSWRADTTEDTRRSKSAKVPWFEHCTFVLFNLMMLILMRVKQSFAIQIPLQAPSIIFQGSTKQSKKRPTERSLGVLVFSFTWNPTVRKNGRFFEPDRSRKFHRSRKILPHLQIDHPRISTCTKSLITKNIYMESLSKTD